MTTRVLVTGATGFIGRHVLDRLATLGAGELHAANRSGVQADARATFHHVDLRDGEAACRLIREIQPTHLIHCAWIATPGVYLASAENLDWLRSSIDMFEAFGKAGGRRVVSIGTSAEYLPDGDLCREDATPLLPASVYGKCKLACSAALSAAAELHGFTFAWGRLFLPYGPGDPPQRLVPALMKAMSTRQPFNMSDGLQKRDFIWAPDAGNLLAALAMSDVQGHFNVGTGVGTLVRDVAARIAAMYAAEDCLRLGVIPMRPGEPPALVADMTKVRRQLGWEASVSVEQGLQALGLRQPTSKP